MSLEIEQIPCLSDNYGYLVHEPTQGITAAIDTPEAAPILAALERRGWQLDYIWNTHHHYDHAGNNEIIKAATGAQVSAPAAEADKIPAIDKTIREGDTVQLGAVSAQVLDVGGHTRGHIAYYFAEDDIVFVGDTLFALGCGRVFEGTMAQMWTSLSKLAALPRKTRSYCAHEYTSANADFALTIDPDNAALIERIAQIKIARGQGLPTVPSTIGEELDTNPFLRVDDGAIRAHLDMPRAENVDVFAEIRRRKDSF